jgi:hypothetical protein
MRSRSGIVPAAAAIGALLFVACSNDPLPGTMLGTYEVVGQANVNSCGLAAPSPWTFDVQLSEEDTTLYWSWMDGTPLLSSPLSTESATLLATEQVNVDGTADGGLGPCTMQRDDSLPLTLGSGSPPSSFTGSITYAFSATDGSNCSDQLAAAGGMYSTLPCTITYTVTATRQ